MKPYLNAGAIALEFESSDQQPFPGEVVSVSCQPNPSMDAGLTSSETGWQRLGSGEGFLHVETNAIWPLYDFPMCGKCNDNHPPEWSCVGVLEQAVIEAAIKLAQTSDHIDSRNEWEANESVLLDVTSALLREREGK